MHKYLLLFLLVNPAWALDLSQYLKKPGDPTRPDRIRISGLTTLRSTSYFRLNQNGSELNVMGYLNAGTEAEIVNINTNLQFGVGVQVRITSGPNIGQLGWVYYSKDPTKRSVELYNGDNIIDIESLYELPDQQDGTVSVPPEDLVDHYFDVVKDSTESIHSRRYISYIWKEVTRRPDLYTVNIEDYDGGDLVPIDYRYEDSNGITVHRRFYGNFADSQMVNIPENIQRHLARIKSGCDDPVTEEVEEQQPEVAQTYSTENWIEGCDVLEGGVEGGDQDRLKICLENIQAAITEGTSDSEGRVSREAVFENLYRKLNPVEQRFAAMVFTAAGEAGTLTPPNEEMMAIMKVLDNRKRDANERWDPDANVLDMALQNLQFSFYNRERNPASEAWRRIMLRADMNNHPHINRAVEAFIGYENGAQMSPLRESDDIFHYYSTILDPPRNPYSAPDWADNETPVNFVINEQALDGYHSDRMGKRVKHKFYSNIAWRYRGNAFRRAVEEEQAE